MIVDTAQNVNPQDIRIRTVSILADLEISIALLIRLGTADSRSPFSLRAKVFDNDAAAVNRLVRLGCTVLAWINNEASFDP